VDLYSLLRATTKQPASILLYLGLQRKSYARCLQAQAQ
jgi:hypothetical protein